MIYNRLILYAVGWPQSCIDRFNMQKALAAIMILATVMVSQSRATPYDFTFTQTGGPTTADGQIDVTGGLATSGTLDVTGGVGIGSYALVPGSGGDGFFVWDGVVATGSDPFLDVDGLLFSNGTNEFNLWGNSPGNYNIDGNIGGTYNPVAIGEAALASVPDSGLTAALIGGAVAGLAALRRRFAK